MNKSIKRRLKFMALALPLTLLPASIALAFGLDTDLIDDFGENLTEALERIRASRDATKHRRVDLQLGYGRLSREFHAGLEAQWNPEGCDKVTGNEALGGIYASQCLGKTFIVPGEEACRDFDNPKDPVIAECGSLGPGAEYAFYKHPSLKQVKQGIMLVPKLIYGKEVGECATVSSDVKFPVEGTLKTHACVIERPVFYMTDGFGGQRDAVQTDITKKYCRIHRKCFKGGAATPGLDVCRKEAARINKKYYCGEFPAGEMAWESKLDTGRTIGSNAPSSAFQYQYSTSTFHAGHDDKPSESKLLAEVRKFGGVFRLYMDRKKGQKDATYTVSSMDGTSANKKVSYTVKAGEAPHVQYRFLIKPPSYYPASDGKAPSESRSGKLTYDSGVSSYENHEEFFEICLRFPNLEFYSPRTSVDKWYLNSVKLGTVTYSDILVCALGSLSYDSNIGTTYYDKKEEKDVQRKMRAKILHVLNPRYKTNITGFDVSIPWYVNVATSGITWLAERKAESFLREWKLEPLIHDEFGKVFKAASEDLTNALNGAVGGLAVAYPKLRNAIQDSCAILGPSNKFFHGPAKADAVVAKCEALVGSSIMARGLHSREAPGYCHDDARYALGKLARSGSNVSLKGWQRANVQGWSGGGTDDGCRLNFEMEFPNNPSHEPATRVFGPVLRCVGNELNHYLNVTSFPTQYDKALGPDGGLAGGMKVPETVAKAMATKCTKVLTAQELKDLGI